MTAALAATVMPVAPAAPTVDQCTPAELIRLSLDVASGSAEPTLSPAAWSRIGRAHSVLGAIVHGGGRAYGVTTGVGHFADRPLAPAEQEEHQRRLLRSHAAGMGPLLPRSTVALMLLLRVRTIARGHSGTAPETIGLLLQLLGRGIVPEVPSRGSVGASGDLAPLAHGMLPLIGEGWCSDPSGRRLSGRDALQRLGAPPRTLAAKEALSLINGTALCGALVLEGWTRLRTLWEAAAGATALAFVGLDGRTGVLDARVAALHALPGTEATAAVLREWLGLSAMCAERPQRPGQDPYSLRCAPQVLGAVLADLDEVGARLAVVLDSVTDNPLVDVERGVLLSGGNFHGLMLGRLADRLTSAAANLGTLLERQIALAIDGRRSGLPDFLVPDGGLNSGLMMHHVTAAALASELKLLAAPASVDSIPTSNDQEDVVPMAPVAGVRLHDALDRLADLLAIALTCQAQALHVRSGQVPPEPLRPVLTHVREHLSPLESDRALHTNLLTLAQTLTEWRVWHRLGARS